MAASFGKNCRFRIAEAGSNASADPLQPAPRQWHSPPACEARPCVREHIFCLSASATIKTIAIPAAGLCCLHESCGWSREKEISMPLVSMRQLLDEAAKGGYGVGAFNVNNMEQIQAIMGAAKETNSPVIIQASRGARQFAEDRYLFHLILAASELHPDIPIAMHQDHGNSFETCKSAISLGFTSVMMDGSLKEDGKTPTTFEENVEVTRKV